MSVEPLISVVVPVHNGAAYLSDALGSIAAQGHRRLDIVVVDDGSTDESASIARSFEKVIYLHQPNRGVATARNTGIEHASGEFIAFLDADDLWLPNYLEAQIEFVREHDCDLVCADAEVFSDSARNDKTYMESLMPEAPPTGEVTFLGLLSAAQSLITSGVVARRDPIMKVGMFDEALRNAQDFDLWLRLAHRRVRMAYQRRALLRYRSRSNSLSGDEVNVHRRELRVLEKVESDYDLSRDERAEVVAVIESRRAILEFELGKLFLTQGEFARAREAFGEANRLRRSWKTSVALWSSSVAPRLMQSLYVRRLGHA